MLPPAYIPPKGRSQRPSSCRTSPWTLQYRPDCETPRILYDIDFVLHFSWNSSFDSSSACVSPRAFFFLYLLPSSSYPLCLGFCSLRPYSFVSIVVFLFRPVFLLLIFPALLFHSFRNFLSFPLFSFIRSGSSQLFVLVLICMLYPWGGFIYSFAIIMSAINNPPSVVSTPKR